MRGIAHRKMSFCLYDEVVAHARPADTCGASVAPVAADTMTESQMHAAAVAAHAHTVVAIIERVSNTRKRPYAMAIVDADRGSLMSSVNVMASLAAAPASATTSLSIDEQVAAFAGTRRLAAIRKRLSTLLAMRSDDQVRFHNEMLLICLPSIFKEDWNRNSAAIVRATQLAFDFDIMGLIISTPRRFGKTTAVASFVAAMLLECAGVSIIVYATGKRAAEQLSRQAWEIMGPYTCTEGRTVEVRNQELTRLRRFGVKTELRCVPSNAVTARGTGGAVIILEEFGFMDDTFFRTVVVPILSVSGSRIIAISSPSDQAVNHMRTSMDAIDQRTGKNLFKSISVTRMCPACAAVSKIDCDHVIPSNPPWRTSADENRLLALYDGSEREGHRELLGAVVSSDTCAFGLLDLERLFKTKAGCYAMVGPGAERPQRIYIAFDPSAGGQGSDSAWVSFYFPAVHGSCASSLVVSFVVFVILLFVQ
jgi:hypothetical protein